MVGCRTLAELLRTSTDDSDFGHIATVLQHSYQESFEAAVNDKTFEAFDEADAGCTSSLQHSFSSGILDCDEGNMDESSNTNLEVTLVAGQK